ncbi:hypothetical protein Tco_0203669 [Tanacetum coccineum]
MCYVNIFHVMPRVSALAGCDRRAKRFLADDLEDLDSDGDDLLLHTTSIFKADHVDAFDSDCDEALTASAIFMARLSPAGSINGYVVCPTYDSDMLSEVPHYDTHHDTDMLNPIVQETEHLKHFVSFNDSYNELTSNSSVSSCVGLLLSRVSITKDKR